MAGTFVIEKRDNGEFQFNLQAENGQVILTSEGYSAKQACLDGVESVRTNSQDDARYARNTAQRRQAVLQPDGHERPGDRREPDVRRRSRPRQRDQLGQAERARRGRGRPHAPEPCPDATGRMRSGPYTAAPSFGPTLRARCRVL